MSKKKTNIILIITILIFMALATFLIMHFDIPNRISSRFGSQTTTELEIQPNNYITIPSHVTPSIEPTEEPTTVIEETVPVNVEIAEQIKKVEKIYANKEDYHEHLIDKLQKYPEALDFVYNYPKLKDEPIEENIDVSDDMLYNRIPHYLQWDLRWGYQQYAGTFMGVSGCGPTALSIAYTGLTKDGDFNPSKAAYFAEENGWGIPNSGSSSDLFTVGGPKLGLEIEDFYGDEAALIKALQEGKFVVLNVGPGHFTRGGHFIVAVGVNKDNKITIIDPNSIINTERKWTYSEFSSEVKTGWIYSAANKQVEN